MVLKRLLSAARLIEDVRHFVPEGERVYAVGDIHGRLDLLEALLTQIDEDDAGRDPARTSLIFLGDLIDRGPDSRGVVERLMQVAAGPRETHFLLGNHEEVFLRAVTGDPKAVKMLTRVGGRETVLSYGISIEDYQNCHYDELAEMLPRCVPAEHIAFVQSFEDWVEKGDYLFVHAGVRPGVAIAEQSTTDLRWIRDSFLDHRDYHDKMIIHGHSITGEVDVCRNRIGIDTGAYSTGRLTAIGLEGEERWFLAT
jgi:serine/threonine protein phosphatase 1